MAAGDIFFKLRSKGKTKKGERKREENYIKKRGKGLKNAQYTPGSILPQYDSG